MEPKPERKISKIAKVGCWMIFGGNGIGIGIAFIFISNFILRFLRLHMRYWRIIDFAGPAGFLIAGIGLFVVIAGIIHILVSKGRLKGIPLSLIAISLESLLILIAIPNFLRFQDGPRNREAKMNLGAIYTAYSMYHSDYNTYPSEAMITIEDPVSKKLGITPIPKDSYNCLAIADYEPKGQTRYAYECMNRIVYPNTQGTPIDDCPVLTSADKNLFIVAACGNIDGDEVLDVWTINEKKELINVINDLRE